MTEMSTGKIETYICEILSQSVMPNHSSRFEANHRRLLRGLVLVLALVTALTGHAAAEDLNLEKIDPYLREGLSSAESTDTFVVWIVFIDRPSWDDNPDDRLPPVDSDYVDQVSSIPGVKPRWVDELLNALSVEATAVTIYAIVGLPFVSEIRPVPIECVIPEGCEDSTQGLDTREVDTREEGPPLVSLAMILSAFAVLAVVGLAVRIRRPPNSE